MNRQRSVVLKIINGESDWQLTGTFAELLRTRTRLIGWSLRETMRELPSLLILPSTTAITTIVSLTLHLSDLARVTEDRV